MPLSYQPPAVASEFTCFIHPTPFVNITKNFAKSGSGEILGVTYSITLDGTLLAGMGSPYVTISGANDANMTVEFAHKAGSLDTGDRNDDKINWGSVVDQGKEYRAIQKKQKALMNLFSKGNEGGLMRISPPNNNGFEGIFFYPRFISLDFPAHNPGNPNISTYSIQLEADTLWGPNESNVSGWTERDYDSFIHGMKTATTNDTSWMIADAQETWDVQEGDSRAIRRADNPEKGPGDGSSSAAVSKDADGNVIDFETGVSTGVFGDVLKESIFKSHKTYTMSRTVSATGKSQFSSELIKPANAKQFYKTFVDRGDSPYIGTPVHFWKEYNPTTGFHRSAYNREAWQQARGFVYDVLRYGDWFTKGVDQIESANGLSSGFAAGFSTINNDDLDKGGINLDGYGVDHYKGWNYTRSQQVDKLGGGFTVTENWILAPADVYALETVDISIEESGDSPLLNVSINGSIEGLVDNASWIDAYGNRQDFYWNYQADDDVDYNLGVTGTQDNPTTTNPGNQTTIVTLPIFQSKFQAAEARFNYYNRMMYQTIQSSVNRLSRYNVKMNPKPVSVSTGLSPLTGSLTYSMSFNNAPETYLPFALSEDVSVSDTMPGEVFASNQVIGRTRGPVFQDIRTQTQWERRLSISCVIDTVSYSVFDDRQHDDLSIIQKTNENQVEGLTKNRVLGERNLWSEVRIPAEGAVPRFSEKIHPTEPQQYKIGYLNAMKAKPSANPQQRESIMRIINMFRPIPGLDGITKAFMNAPSETWNPRTGTYSLDISWVYECEGGYTQATNGGIPLPGGGAVLPASAPTQINNPTTFNTTFDPNWGSKKPGNGLDENFFELRTP